jgi:1-acyl-sn-glycerol-3-phosphate acyltransferase
MVIAVCGFDGPIARAVRAELTQRGHTIIDSGVDPRAEAVIWFPGDPAVLEKIAARTDLQRLVVRSHAYTYGSNPKNPGVMDEARVSLLPPTDKAQRWLQYEAIAARNPNWVALRLTNVLAPEEGDLIVNKLVKGSASFVAGRDPNLQFISVQDAANAFVAAVESNATGVFNIAGEGSIPLKKAARAAGTGRFAVPPSGDLAELVFNWTISGDRAAQELGYRPSQSTFEALRAFLTTKPGARPERLAQSYDDWGLDVDYIRAWGWWFAFLRNIYWRIESEGMENIPATGKGVFVSNHRGFMPLDAVMHLSLLFTHTGRVPRFLIVHSLLRTPFLANFLTKLGGVVASQENAKRLFDQGNIVGIFPEGIRGTFLPYKRTYKLRSFARSEYTRLAVEHQAPIIPTAVIGHAEIFPIIGRIDSSWVVKELGWPYLPIAPMFPLAPIPMPSKWHVRVLPQVGLQGLKPEDAQNDRLMKSFSDYIQSIVQTNIDDMLPRRKSIFFGKKVLNGKPPVAPPFTRARRAEV